MPLLNLPIRPGLLSACGTPVENIGAPRETNGSGVALQSGGFTLIELLVVVFIIAVASAVAALLDAARANARAQRVSLLWRCDESGFSVLSTIPSAAPVKHSNWQAGSAVCDPNQGVVGPEPITKAQVINVYSVDATTKSGVDVNNAVQIATDGLGPFKLATE